MGGPTAWEAREELSRATGTLARPPPACVTQMPAVASLCPKGFCPLNALLARPSQKLRKLKTALTAVGVLRPVTRRVLIPPTWKRASGRGAQTSTSLPGVTPMNCLLNTPWDPTTSLRPLGKGKSAGRSVSFGPPPPEGVAPNCERDPGLIWFLARTSAPAW